MTLTKARLESMKKEIELKYRIASQADMELLQSFLEPYQAGEKRYLKQENSYFDTPALDLKRNGISLRLRKQNQVFLLCAKQSFNQKSSGKNLSVRLEYETELDEHIAKLIDDGLLSALDAFSALKPKKKEEAATKKVLYRHMRKAATVGLQCVGMFSNHRTLLPVNLWEEELTLEFDHTTDPRSVEIFEVEVEFRSIKQAQLLQPALEKIFLAANVKTYRSNSKSSRLYKLLYG